VHPIRLARILAEKWADLPDSTREVVLEELAEGGVTAKGSPKAAGMPSSSATEAFIQLSPEQQDMADLKLQIIRMQLKMSDTQQGAPLDLVEVLGLLAALTGHISTLGDMLHTVWGAWQNLEGDKRIQPSNASRRPIIEHLRESLSRRSSGTGELTAALRDQIAAARLLIAILSGLGQGSQSFANALSRYLDPDSVVQELRKSRGGRPPSPEDLWNRYRQLGDSLTPSEIEHRLMLQVVENAEVFYQASQRG
jgi:hypothetical protein